MESITSLQSPELKAFITKYSPFVKELRKRIIFTFSIFIISVIGGFIFYEQIIRFLITLFSLEGINVVFTSPFQFINLAVACGASIGLILILPLIIYQLFSFLKPALKKTEYKMIVGIFPFCILLFLIGFAFGAFIMRWQIQIFLETSLSLGIGNILDVSNLLATVLLTSTLMGIGFQFPIVLYLLMKIGVLERKTLSKLRSWIYIGSFLFAILLPADSILADVLLSLPLILMFELTLLLNRISKKEI